MNKIVLILSIVINIIILGLLLLKKVEKYQLNISNIPIDMLNSILPSLDLKDLNNLAMTGKQQMSEVNQFLNGIFGNIAETDRIQEEISRLQQEISQFQNELTNKTTGLSTINNLNYYYQTSPSEEGEKYLRMIEEILNTIGAKYVKIFETKNYGKILVADYSNLPYVYSNPRKRNRDIFIGLKIGENLRDFVEVAIMLMDTSSSPNEIKDDSKLRDFRIIYETVKSIMFNYYPLTRYRDVDPFGGNTAPINKNPIYGWNWAYGSTLISGYVTNSPKLQTLGPIEGYNKFISQLI